MKSTQQISLFQPICHLMLGLLGSLLITTLLIQNTAYSSCNFKTIDVTCNRPRTQKLVETFFFSRFSNFFVHFKAFSVISRLKSTKKCFDQLLGARSTQKLVEIHNSKYTFVIELKFQLKVLDLNRSCF